MYAKLAFRNLKRQASSYIVYFITVIISVAMMFAVNNIFLSDEIWNFLARSWAKETVRSILVIVIVIVTFVVCVTICYATAFLLRKRKKELGTYLLLGIKRSAIALMFVAENAVIGVVSFMCGCLLGIGVFEVLNVVICSLMDNVIRPIVLSAAGFSLTLAQWAGIISVSLAYAAFILGRAKISRLIGGAPSVKLQPKYPWIEWALAVVAFGGICFGAFYGVFLLGFSLNGGDPTVVISGVPVATVILFVSIFLFHLFLRSVYAHRLMRKPKSPSAPPARPAAVTADEPDKPSAAPAPVPDYGKRAYNGGNMFYLRQMSFSMNRNAVMIGLIAVLLSVAIIAMNIAFLLRELSLADIRYGFDICCWFSDEEDYHDKKVKSPEELITDVGKYSEPSFMRVFYIYKPSTMKISDYNALAAELGENEISLEENEYYYIGTSYQKENDRNPLIDGLMCGGSTDRSTTEGNEVLNAFTQGYGIYVSCLVPDNVVAEETEKSCEFLIMNTMKHLPIEFSEKYAYSRVHNRYREIDNINSQYAVVIIAAIFLGVTFMLLAMALLSVKALSDADADRRRYAILGMLGVSAAEQRKLLFKQQFNFLVAPLVIPLLLTVPLVMAGAVISNFMMDAVSPIVFAIGFSVPFIYAAIYAAYFAATYYLSVKTSLKPHDKNRIKVLRT